MKGLLIILGGLTGIIALCNWGDPEPLLIDATVSRAGGDWCDILKNRPPMPKKRLNPMVNGLDKPNGDVA